MPIGDRFIRKSKRRVTPTRRERAIIDTIRIHLPARKFGVKHQTGGPTCALLDILTILGQRLPYKLKE